MDGLSTLCLAAAFPLTLRQDSQILFPTGVQCLMARTSNIGATRRIVGAGFGRAGVGPVGGGWAIGGGRADRSGEPVGRAVAGRRASVGRSGLRASAEK